MIDIAEMMNRFCAAGAHATERYVQISGLIPAVMPEYFLSSHIFDKLGGQTTATLETSFSALVEWNADVRKRRGLPVREPDEMLLVLAQQSSGRRVDMVLFEGEELGKPKELQDIYALVEFKRGYIDAGRDPGRISDRDKVLMLLANIDTCPWGGTCGWVSENHRQWQITESIKETCDQWFETPVDLPKSMGISVYFCARIFARDSDNSRLGDLQGSFLGRGIR